MTSAVAWHLVCLITAIGTAACSTTPPTTGVCSDEPTQVAAETEPVPVTVEEAAAEVAVCTDAALEARNGDPEAKRESR